MSDQDLMKEHWIAKLKYANTKGPEAVQAVIEEMESFSFSE